MTQSLLKAFSNCVYFILIFLTFTQTGFTSDTIAQEPKPADVRELTLGAPIERELSGGEVHTYRVSLVAGQYLQIDSEQKSVDIKIRVIGPNGRSLSEVDTDPAGGSESVFVVAEISGDHRVEAQSSKKDAKTGAYRIGITELRVATARDQARVTAERIFEEANRLRDQRTAESRRSAIQKYEEGLPMWRDLADIRKQGLTLNELGYVYSTLGERKKALDYYERAVPLYRAVGDRINEGITVANIGLNYRRLGEIPKALEYYLMALELSRSTGDRTLEATILSNIGAVHTALGQPEQSLKYLNEALPLRRIIGDPVREAITLNDIGNSYSLMGEFQKALEHYDQALVCARAGGDHGIEASTFVNLGGGYRRLGESQKAFEYYELALPILHSMGNRERESYVIYGLGGIYQEWGDGPKALDYYNQAVKLFRANGDRSGEAYALSDLGTVYIDLNEPQKALDYFDQALSLRRAVGDRQGEANTLGSTGVTYAAIGDPKKALEYCNQALQLCRLVGDRNGEAGALHNLAAVLRDLGNLPEARTRIEAALDIIESIRVKVASQELRSSYLASKQNSYELYIDLLMQMHKQNPLEGYDGAALQASERARARGLLETLSEARANIREGIAPELLQRERSSQQKLNASSEQLTRLLSGKFTEEQATAARKEVENVLSEYQQIDSQIRAQSPRYAALTQPHPLSLKGIQRQVLDEDTLLLEYALGDNRSYLWAVTPTSLTSFELPKRIEIETAARRVYDLLVKKGDALYPEALISLSQTLLGPVANQLGKKRLLIVGAGALQYVPFGALPLPSPPDPINHSQKSATAKLVIFKPLVVDHEIANSPSASVLALLRQDLSRRTVASNKLVVLADPVFTKDDERVKSANSNQQIDGASQKRAAHTALSSDVERSAGDVNLASFDRLPVTRNEADVIAAMVPKAQSLKALDFAASRATATSPSLGHYQIVHFATHSLLNNRHPELSGIVLSLFDERGQPQDGFLRLHEIYNLKLESDLVVLSACQTALGKEIKGEGLVGLTRGFMYAGSPRVVASVWKVSDRATAELMKRFYQKMLKEGLRPAAALRAAQVSMLKEKQWAAPYYWAGFVLQGEWK